MKIYAFNVFNSFSEIYINGPERVFILFHWQISESFKRAFKILDFVLFCFVLSLI